MINLLATKFHIPTSTHHLLARPRLIERLEEGNYKKVTLISAPAGFGKSTLLGQWVAAIKHPVGWLSIDANDNDPIRFMTYLIGAIQKIHSSVGQDALEILHATRTPAYDSVLTMLLNEISESSVHFTLILDDFHFISDAQVHEIISFIIDNMPSEMHLVISTRLDPQFPLARMRARQELVELRSKDLRLDPEETIVLLNDLNGLNLTLDEIHLLDERVEGWMAGLQMAMLSIQGREDVSQFIKNFTGSNRFILDYLMEEVLNQQTSEIKEFLLSTSILERLDAFLCNTIMEREDSQEILTRLEQSNAFVIPLDNERNWYRYHHLMKDLLQKRLMQTHPARIPDLHIRASTWCDREGLFTEAISHALRADDLDRVANLVEKYGFAVTSFNQEKTVTMWLERLPLEVIRNRPWLCILQAWLHYSFGPRPKAKEFLQMAEELVTPASMVVSANPAPRPLSENEQTRLRGAIAAVRAHLAIVEHNFQAALDHVHLAFGNLDDNDPWRTTAMVALGAAYLALGEIKQSENIFAQTSAVFLQKGNWDGIVSSLCYKGLMQLKQGNLRSSYDTYTEALQRATRPDGVRILFAGIPFLRIGDLLREWNDLAHAQESIDNGIAYAEKLNHPDVLIEAHICQARLQLARKDHARTIAALQRADRIFADYDVDPWYLGWLLDCWVCYWLSIGDWKAAVSRVEASGLTMDGSLSYHNDLHHISLARVLVAQGKQDPAGHYLDEAEKLLNRLLEAAEQMDWIHETIKVLILMGILFWAAGQKDRAVEWIVRALILAEPGGYVRIFADEGPPMEKLFSHLLLKNRGEKAMDANTTAYAENLLQTLRKEGGETIPPISPKMSTMAEPLSERELEVLRYLNTHLSSTEIAQKLNISANTVRFHIKNIYSKLNANRRADAVQRAQDLNIL